jgi:hypothetical protein
MEIDKLTALDSIIELFGASMESASQMKSMIRKSS